MAVEPQAQKNPEIVRLEGMIAQQQKVIDGLVASKKTSGATVRNRTREHHVYIREFVKDGETRGLVTRVSDVKERRDPTEAKRFIGVCTLSVLDPATKKVEKIEEVDYLAFLNEAPRVRALILNWDRKERFAVGDEPGGGGIGPLKKPVIVNGIPQDEVVVDPNYEFENGYVDHVLTIKLEDGKFKDAVITTDEKALNI